MTRGPVSVWANVLRTLPAPAKARAYFAAQSVGGALWWVAVFASDDVQRWTLGTWNPRLLVAPDLVLFAGASALAAAFGSRVWAVVASAWTTPVTIALTAYALVEREAGWGAVLMVLANGRHVGCHAYVVVRTAAGAVVLSRAVHVSRGARSIAWRTSSPQPHAARVLLGHVPHPVAARLVVRRTTFATRVVSAAALRLRVGRPDRVRRRERIRPVVMRVDGACRRRHTAPAATARNLVVVGPYRFVRNPMAVAGALQTVGVGLWRGSWIVIVSSITGALIWNTFIRPEEEADLAARFGDDYDAYRAVVRCWIPIRHRAAVISRQ